MTQTTKGRNGTPQKQVRPGQRQQERLMRLARRRRRRQIWTASITAALLIVIASVSFWQYQRYTTQQAVDKAAKATAVAIAHAHATGTAVVQNCSLPLPVRKLIISIQQLPLLQQDLPPHHSSLAPQPLPVMDSSILI